MLMLEPASILTLESFRRLPPIVHKGNPGYRGGGQIRSLLIHTRIAWGLNSVAKLSQVILTRLP